MYRTQPIDSGVRGSAAILVIAAHVAVIYAIAVTLGVIEAPVIPESTKAVFVPTIQPVDDPPPPPSKSIYDPKVWVPAPDPIRDPPPVTNTGSQITGTTIVPPITDPVPVESGSPPVLERTNLQVTRRVDPVYPPGAIRGNEDGTVRLRLLVD